MESETKNKIQYLIRDINTLNKLKSENANLLLFVSEIAELTGLIYEKELQGEKELQEKYTKELLKLIDSQVDGYKKTAFETSNENYNLDRINDILNDKINVCLNSSKNIPKIKDKKPA